MNQQHVVMSSAGNTRGLIEASAANAACRSSSSSSAGNTRGLIEATTMVAARVARRGVFRGEYPRPH